MASAIENTTRIDAQFLKRLPRMYVTGVSINDISKERDIIKGLLRFLGYASAN